MLSIPDILKVTGLTQAAMAAELGSPKRTLESWCMGQRKPPEYLVRLIAEHYGIK